MRVSILFVLLAACGDGRVVAADAGAADAAECAFDYCETYADATPFCATDPCCADRERRCADDLVCGDWPDCVTDAGVVPCNECRHRDSCWCQPLPPAPPSS
jgi:hypothetical protein